MTTQNANPYGMGKTYPSGSQEHLLGGENQFPDIEGRDSHGNLKDPETGLLITAIFVKNESGGTLAAGTAVTSGASTNGPIKACGVAAAGGTSQVVGFVDHLINGTVADDDHFWMVVRGPTKVLSTTGTAIAKRDNLTLGASGRVVKQPGTLTAQSNFDYVGEADEVVATGDASDTLFRAFVNIKAR